MFSKRIDWLSTEWLILQSIEKEIIFNVYTVIKLWLIGLLDGFNAYNKVTQISYCSGNHF